MSTTSIVILSQLGIALLVAIVLLALYARRQKKTVIHLQDTLRELKEELSGETLVRYLQLSADDCRSHCQQDNIDLAPAHDANSQALALRYAALSAELSNLQTYNGEMTPITFALKPYLALVDAYQQHLRAQCDRVRVDAESDQKRLNNQIEELNGKIKACEVKLRELRGLTNAFDAFNTTPMSKDDIELQLHTALLEICDGLSNPAPMREVVYLLHEAYQERDLRPASFDQIDTPKEAAPATSSAPPDADTESLMQVIEQFTEDSAGMVERIHLLTNQNKQLHMEIEQLKAELTRNFADDDEQAPTIAAMKVKLEQQNAEILALQSNYRDLENQYLALYEQSGGTG